MFREMRRSDLELSKEEAVRVLAQCRYITLAMMGENGYPYSLPISFAYEDGRVFIHGHKSGHKVDALTRSDKVSFSAVLENEVNPAGFTVAYTSIVAFGWANQLEDSEKERAIHLILGKYSADHKEKSLRVVKSLWDEFAAFQICIDHITGKSSMKKRG